MCVEGAIATDRVGLRLAPLSVADVDAYFALVDRNRAHLTQHGDYRSMLTATRTAAREELEAAIDALVLGLWLHCDLIGRVDLIPKGDGNFVIGYWLDHRALGQAHMTAACRALIAYARTNLGAVAIFAGVTKGNRASEAVLERLGFVAIQDMGTYTRFRLHLDEDSARTLAHPAMHPRGRFPGDGMRSVTIVQAQQLEDAAAIAALYPSKSREEQQDMVRESLQPAFLASQRGERTILLARSDGGLVGTVQVVWENATEESALVSPGFAVIHHLRTHPDFRRQGIGQRLMREAQRLALARQVTSLTLAVEQTNAYAHRLYEKWGFRDVMTYRGSDGELLIGMVSILA
jgi:ribosomal-protein-serine acetyltransferase